MIIKLCLSHPDSRAGSSAQAEDCGKVGTGEHSRLPRREKQEYPRPGRKVQVINRTFWPLIILYAKLELMYLTHFLISSTNLEEIRNWPAEKK